MVEWNSRIMVARTIYLNVIKIDIKLVEIYNTHYGPQNIIYRIWYINTKSLCVDNTNYWHSIHTPNETKMCKALASLKE
jgi:hypothetical protein